MVLPPERITVKRRRDEEPVDALYIPPKKSRTALVWNRISQDQATWEKNCTRNAYQHPRVPAVKTTPCGADKSSTLLLPVRNEVTDEKIENIHDCPQSARHLGNAPETGRVCASQRPTLGARRFHLKKPAVSAAPPATLHGGIRKPKKKQTKAFAMFVERARESKTPPQSVAYESTNVPEQRKSRGHLEATNRILPPQKRPLASSAERDWRAHTWKRPPEANRANLEAKTTIQDSDQGISFVLAQRMQQFALQERQSQVAFDSGQTQGQSKVRPKPPKPRIARTDLDGPEQISNAKQNILDTLDEEGCDYVLDVYVRRNGIGQNASNELENLGLEMVDPDKVGMLVIEEGEDEKTWELYGAEDCCDDETWNSEEEDENAEDYYGNDYPEDELDLDDQHDRNMYKHWQGAFEEEEFEGYISRSYD
ncbi:MAG: hypothetical protein Q9220_007442 [cf. Caloplaca sp. 1 TL-2023]